MNSSFPRLAALALISCLAVIPLANGSAVSPMTVLTPPFTTATLSDSSQGSSAGACGLVSYPVSPSFQNGTGNLSMEMNSSTPTCLHHGINRAVLGNQIGVVIRFGAPTGVHKIVANFSVAWNESWGIIRPTCLGLNTTATFGCNLQVRTEFGSGGNLTFAKSKGRIPLYSSSTTWASTPKTEESTWHQTCTYPTNQTCKTGKTGALVGARYGTANLSWTFSGYLNGSKLYEVNIWFALQTYSECQFGSGGSMTGGLAYAEAGIGAKLSSITIA
jgi:hypothetical protein